MKKQIDLQKKITQIMNVMMNFRWHTLKCPQVVHFQVPNDNDPNQARAVQHQWKYLQLNVILCRRQWTNIGFEMNLIPTDGAFPYYRVTACKTFDRLSYSVGVACPSFYFIPFPVTWEASIAYTVKPPCFILGEIQNTSKPYNGDNNPEGYVLLGGIGVDILRNFRGILFYQVYKNNFDYDVPYTRFDRRFGTQIQFHVQ